MVVYIRYFSQAHLTKVPSNLTRIQTKSVEEAKCAKNPVTHYIPMSHSFINTASLSKLRWGLWVFMLSFFNWQMLKSTLYLFIDWLIKESSFFKFIYFWLCWVFIAARGLSLVAGSGGYCSLWRAGFSLRCLLLLQSTGSRHVGFSSCGTRAQ